MFFIASLPTKQDLVLNSASGGAPSIWPLVQAMLVLGALFALLKWGGPKLIGRMGKRLSTSLDSPIRLQEAAQCGVASLQVVEVRGRTLLLASGPQGVTFLADLTSTPESAAPPAFFEMLDSAEGTHEKAVVTDHEAYERLTRLTEGHLR